MKMLTKSIAAVAMATMFTGAAMASTQFEAADDATSSSICVAVAKGNKIKLHDKIKQSFVDKKFVAEKLTCNGMPVSEFVDLYGSNGEAIKRYLNIESPSIASVSYVK